MRERSLSDFKPPIHAIEFFAGGGGFSDAFRQALEQLDWIGKLLLAVNHNPVAIRTHKRNFPGTEHRQAKVEALVMELLYDAQILFGSPECRYQTTALGKKLKYQRRRSQPGLWTDLHTASEAERSRASMWQMYEAARVKMKQGHPFQIVLVENVVEASTKWADHDDWVDNFRSLGYRYQGLFINAQHLGAAQSRDRYFAVFTLKDLPEPNLEFRPQAYCHSCRQYVEAIQSWKPGKKRRGKYGQQYHYRCPYLTCGQIVTPFFRPAACFLDFADRGQRIGERTRPLCSKTTQRIKQGLEAFREGQPVPSEAYDLPASLPETLPLLIKYNSNGKAESVFRPLGTVSSRDRYGLVFLPENWIPGTIPSIEDCSFRMLSTWEIQQAMGMEKLDMTGMSRSQIIKHCGLAVVPQVGVAILLRLLPLLIGLRVGEPVYSILEPPGERDIHYEQTSHV